MAINIIRDPSRTAMLATGLGQGLRELASLKASQMLGRQQQQKTASGLEALGLSPQESSAIAHLPEQFQNQVLLAYLQRGGGAAAQQISPQPFEAAQEITAPEFQAAEQVGVARPTVAQTLGKPTLKEQRQIQIAEKKLQQGERKIAHQEKALALKTTEKFRTKIYDEAKSAKTELKDLGTLQELNESGKLDTPGYVEFLKRSGLDISALLNPESEQYQKITTNMLRNAKTYFGGKVSNLEMEQFLKAIPQLSNSPEGRKRVIAMMKDQARLKEEYYKAMNDIIRKNKGIPPLDLEAQIEEHIDKIQDKLSEKFKKDLERPVPKAQDRYVTALQAAAGTVTGFAPKLIAPAAGAGLGFLAGGPLGAAIGGGAAAVPGLLNILGK